jgi:hypothetical protein
MFTDPFIEFQTENAQQIFLAFPANYLLMNHGFAEPGLTVWDQDWNTGIYSHLWDGFGTSKFLEWDWHFSV